MSNIKKLIIVRGLLALSLAFTLFLFAVPRLFFEPDGGAGAAIGGFIIVIIAFWETFFLILSFLLVKDYPKAASIPMLVHGTVGWFLLLLTLRAGCLGGFFVLGPLTLSFFAGIVSISIARAREGDNAPRGFKRKRGFIGLLAILFIPFFLSLPAWILDMVSRSLDYPLLRDILRLGPGVFIKISGISLALAAVLWIWRKKFKQEDN